MKVEYMAYSPYDKCVEQVNWPSAPEVCFYFWRNDPPVPVDYTVALWREKSIAKQLLTIPGANTIQGYAIVNNADDPDTITMIKDQYRDNPEGMNRIVGEKLMKRILTLYP